MSKLIGAPALVVPDLVDALVRTDRRLARIDGHNVVLRADASPPADDRVALISGGGSGHEPAHAGYIGAGMLTAAVLGEVFTSPSVDAVLAAIRAVTGAAGCLLIVKNYTGDRLNFGLAAQIARTEGMDVEMVLVDDDAATGGGSRVGARGLAGTVLVHKIAGAAAAAGATLAEVKAVAERAISGLSTMGVALSPCILPGAAAANFTLPPGQVEFGLGIHGEQGVSREEVAPVAELVGRLVDGILASGRVSTGGRPVVAMVNGLGATPAMELALVGGALLARLQALGIEVRRIAVGEFLGALDMAGCSISLLHVDDRLLECLDAATDAPAWSGLAHPGGSGRTVPAASLAGSPDVSSAGIDAEAAARFRRSVEAALACLIEKEDELTALDREVGDGDLGISMRRGANAIEARIADIAFDRPQSALRVMAGIVRETVGGTSGPLMAAFLLGASQAIGQTPNPASVAAVAAALRAGCTAIAVLGGARAGDRTMLDALLPAADALAQAAGSGAANAYSLAAHAAAEGAEQTRHVAAALGRSSYLGDRVIGHPDPGARAAALWLAAVAAALGQR
ncbi:MAG: dak [Sphingomonas bacterium]|nr:dihydroxyacetone kinase subunit DhaL [Sphingomonas bacterium]MDB5690764.1 dak [Sphingomonas bacterium]